MFNIIKNKKLKRFIIINLILVCIGLIIVFIVNMLKDNYRNIYKLGDEVIFEQTYNTIFNEIDIDSKMTDIYIRESNENNVRVVIYGEKEYFNVSEKNNKLFIKNNKKNMIALDFYSCISKIELFIPPHYNDLIRIDSEFGNLQVERFSNLKLNVEQEYGNFLGNEIYFLKLNNEYGNIQIEKINMVLIDSNSSNIKINNVDDLTIDSEFGNIEVENINKKLKLNVENGIITINNLIIDADSSIKANYGKIKIGKTNEIKIKTKTDRGKSKVKNNYKNSEIELDVYNKKGDITIDN